MIAKKIKLLTQYKTNETVRDYFIFLQEYIQKNVFNEYYTIDENNIIQSGVLLKELAIGSAVTEYIKYISFNKYGIIPPYILIGLVENDKTSLNDKDSLNDREAESLPVDLISFKKIIIFILDWKYKIWNIPNLAKMIARFCDVNVTEIKITNVIIAVGNNQFNIDIPNNYYSTVFKSMIDNYIDIMNMPYNYKFNIVLV